MDQHIVFIIRLYSINQFKAILNNLISNLNDCSDTDAPAKLRQIHLSNNDIPGSRMREKGLDKERNFLKNQS